MTAGPPDEASEPTITLHLRRSHLWVAGVVLIALVGGFTLGRVTGGQPQAILYTPSGAAAGEEPPQATSNAPRAPAPEHLASRPARGPDDATVTMVEFVDFECPFCGAYARDTLGRIDSTYGDRIRYISVQFPLAAHPHAQEAARAAVCADDAGVYWEFHELLFNGQDALDREGLLAMAEEAGAGRRAFAACLSSQSARDRVDADLDLALDHGVRSTPTFFIDGKPLVGALPYSQFRDALDEALSR